MPTQVAMGAETIPVTVAEGINSTQANAVLALFTSRYDAYGNKAIFNGKIAGINIVNTSTIWIESMGMYTLAFNFNASGGDLTSLLSNVDTDIDNALTPANVVLNGNTVPVERGAGVSGAQTKVATDLVKSTYDTFPSKLTLSGKIAQINITTGTTGWTESNGLYTLNINKDATAGQITALLDEVVDDIQIPRVYGIKVIGTDAATHAPTIEAAIDYVEDLSAPHAEYIKNNIAEFRIVASGMVIEKENGKWIAKIGTDSMGVDTIGDILANWADEQPDLVAFLQMQKAVKMANADPSMRGTAAATIAQAKAPVCKKIEAVYCPSLVSLGG